jgi:peptidoglycan/xylan/chitin deacetylase (PgdA/CDA1 family)
MYHHVAASPVSRSFGRYVVDPGLLDEQFAALASLRGGERAASPEVVITFDDGLASFGEHVVPRLARHGLGATLFVPTAFVGGRASWLPDRDASLLPLLSWSALRDCQTAGVRLASHGHGHHQLDVMRPADVRADLLTSRQLLEDELGREVTSLAYPFGYHDARVRAAARESGFAFGYEVGYGLHRASGDPLRIRRLLVGPHDGPDRLLVKVTSGGTSAAEHLRRATRPLWRACRRARGRGQQPQSSDGGRVR